MNVYVASSWRNEIQQEVVAALRAANHLVYDFKHPAPDNAGFHWSEIGSGWKLWTPAEFRQALSHPIAQAGFRLDERALRWCDACVLVNPCGRSAHAAAGFAAGAGKHTAVLLPPEEPELMYLLFDAVAVTVPELVAIVGYWEERDAGRAAR